MILWDRIAWAAFWIAVSVLAWTQL